MAGDLLTPRNSGSTQDHIEMDDTSVSRTSSGPRLADEDSTAPRKTGLAGVARHTLGLLLLLCVVFLWTLSNFLGSSIFADNSYAKPFFLTYLNTSMFMLAMIPTLARSAHKQHKRGTLYTTFRSHLSRNRQHTPLQRAGASDIDDSESQAFINKSPGTRSQDVDEKDKHLGIVPTARLSLTFCFLWFGANYFAMACLQHTTVASTTILTSTSSFWTLLIGAFTGMERFSWRKLCGVMGSFVGIILISRVDFSKSADSSTPSPSPDAGDDPTRRAIDTFPDKSPGELALGDGLALLSAIIYGLYTITLKKSTIKAAPRQLNMSLFFGLVGTFNLFLLSPLFPILHYTGIETFQPPPSGHIWTVLLVNSVSSLFSDICWAYAMVLTSPLVVTVGLSLTIPLSLVGEMVLQGRYEGWVYWVGAGIVVASFLFVDHEERGDEAQEASRVSRDESSADSQHDGEAAAALLGGASSSQDLLVEEEGPGPATATSFTAQSTVLEEAGIGRERRKPSTSSLDIHDTSFSDSAGQRRVEGNKTDRAKPLPRLNLPHASGSN